MRTFAAVLQKADIKLLEQQWVLANTFPKKLLTVSLSIFMPNIDRGFQNSFTRAFCG